MVLQNAARVCHIFFSLKSKYPRNAPFEEFRRRMEAKVTVWHSSRQRGAVITPTLQHN